MRSNFDSGARTGSRRLLGFFLPTALAGLCAAGCKQTENAAPHAEVTEEVTARASVTALDADLRTVSLQRDDGTRFVVLAGPEVRNFDQIEVGDVLEVRYRESMAVSLADPGAADVPASATLAAGAAEPGQKPGAEVGQHLTATVRIESIDTKRNFVVFTAPDGALRTVHVVRSEGREFIRKLKPGDRVDITYTEALAISVEKGE